jgi:hypothetical protein
MHITVIVPLVHPLARVLVVSPAPTGVVLQQTRQLALARRAGKITWLSARWRSRARR